MNDTSTVRLPRPKRYTFKQQQLKEMMTSWKETRDYNSGMK